MGDRRALGGRFRPLLCVLIGIAAFATFLGDLDFLVASVVKLVKNGDD